MRKEITWLVWFNNSVMTRGPMEGPGPRPTI